jgi:hypothetical protein
MRMLEGQQAGRLGVVVSEFENQTRLGLRLGERGTSEQGNQIVPPTGSQQVTGKVMESISAKPEWGSIHGRKHLENRFTCDSMQGSKDPVSQLGVS